MTTRKPYTPDELRKLARQRGPQWDGEVRNALMYCADLIQAANAVAEELRARIPQARGAAHD